MEEMRKQLKEAIVKVGREREGERQRVRDRQTDRDRESERVEGEKGNETHSVYTCMYISVFPEKWVFLRFWFNSLQSFC